MKNLYIFAGVDGAGKSTFYIKQLENFNFCGIRISSDEMAKELGDWKNQKVQIRAAKLALKLRKHYLQRGADFNIETTLSEKSIVKFIKKAKKDGYYITLYYIGLNSIELSKQRVAIRTAKNGHSVDGAILERRYKQSFENLILVEPFCDMIYFYDNSDFIKNEQDQQRSNLLLVAVKNGGCLDLKTDKNIDWFCDFMKNKRQTEPKFGLNFDSI